MSFVDQNIHRFKVGNPPTGKINIYRPGYINPIYIIPDIQIGEKFGIITDREAPGVAPYYAISNYGRIWHIYSEIYLSNGWDRGGYVVYSLQRLKNGPLNYRVHRIVMLKYRYFPGCEDTSEYEVNHINGNKIMNYIDDPILGDNLEWITRSKNIIHAYETGLIPRVKNEYSESDIHRVCALLSTHKYSYNQISEMTNVLYSTIAQVALRSQWTNISKDYDF